MNAALLLIPIVLIRYPLMRRISMDAFKRAQHSAVSDTKERFAVNAYQITLFALFGYLFFLKIQFNSVLHYMGLGLYILGTVLYIKSIVDYAKPAAGGINKAGLYRYSRNPMYVAFFIYFLGICLFVESWWYVAILMLFQLSVHYLILAEERWCIQQFGEEYKRYMKEVRRYV